MTTNWSTSNLPNDHADLDKLVKWFREHDPAWMADALWLRYLKIGKQVYEPDIALQSRETQLDQLPSIDREVQNSPPLACNILPDNPQCAKPDHLSALPHDIRVEILSHLRLPDLRIDILGKCDVAGHPISSLGLVSKSWRNQVETFCSHLLLVWKHEVDARRRCCEPSGWVGKRKLATYTANARMEYMLRMKNYCGVCGKLLRTLPSLSGGRLCCFDCKHGSRGEYRCSCSVGKGGD